jgi:hypothetical protein
MELNHMSLILRWLGFQKVLNERSCLKALFLIYVDKIQVEFCFSSAKVEHNLWIPSVIQL